MLKDLLLAGPLCLAVAVAMLLSAAEFARLPPDEVPWHQQVAAVRAGESRGIIVNQATIGDDRLRDLRGLESMSYLELGRSEITAFGVRELTSLPNLRRVALRGRPVDDAMFLALCQIPTVRELNLPDTTITDSGLAALEQRPQLVQLRLSSSQLTDAGMAHIARVPKLRFLHLISIPLTDKGLTAFHKMTDLESLYIDDVQVTDAGIARLLKQLPELHFHLDQAHHDLDPNRANHTH